MDGSMDRIRILLAKFKPLYAELFSEVDIASVDVATLREMVAIYDSINHLELPLDPRQRANIIGLFYVMSRLKVHLEQEAWNEVLRTLPCMVFSYAIR